MRLEREESEEDVALNMTPLLDMMFILIIFFLATSRFQQEERDEPIQLVTSKSTLAIATPQQMLVINIDRQGRKIVDGRERSLEELEKIIRERHLADEGAELVIRPDKRAKVEALAETTEICHRLGIKTPKISYKAAGE